MKCEVCKKTIMGQPDGVHSDDSGEYHYTCYQKIMRESALAAGIPESVYDGKTKLTDHFSQDYIDSQCAPASRVGAQDD